MEVSLTPQVKRSQEVSEAFRGLKDETQLALFNMRNWQYAFWRDTKQRIHPKHPFLKLLQIMVYLSFSY